MGSVGIYASCSIWKYVFVYKAELLVGFFSALSVINYFYRVELYKRKREKTKLNIIRLKLQLMGADEIKYLREMMDRVETNVERFMLKFEAKFDQLEDKYNQLNMNLHKELSKLDKSQGITNAKIAIYISILVSIGLTVLNISIK
jgi:hypothetical protein